MALYAVGKVSSFITRGVYTVSGPFHPFGGAIDIIVVEQPDGTFKSSPWYVRFGKFQGVLKTEEKIVAVSVDGEDADLHMYLDHKGEAFFLRELNLNADANVDGVEYFVSPASSGDEREEQAQDAQLRKSQTLPEGRVVARTSTKRTTILERVFGRRSSKENLDDKDVDRVDSLERAEIAADLLEMRWSSNISRQDAQHAEHEDTRDGGNTGITSVVLNDQGLAHEEVRSSHSDCLHENLITANSIDNSEVTKNLSTTTITVEEVVEIYRSTTADMVKTDPSNLDQDLIVNSTESMSFSSDLLGLSGSSKETESHLREITTHEEVVEIRALGTDSVDCNVLDSNLSKLDSYDVDHGVMSVDSVAKMVGETLHHHGNGDKEVSSPDKGSDGSSSIANIVQSSNMISCIPVNNGRDTDPISMDNSECQDSSNYKLKSSESIFNGEKSALEPASSNIEVGMLSVQDPEDCITSKSKDCNEKGTSLGFSIDIPVSYVEDSSVGHSSRHAYLLSYSNAALPEVFTGEFIAAETCESSMDSPANVEPKDVTEIDSAPLPHEPVECIDELGQSSLPCPKFANSVEEIMIDDNIDPCSRVAELDSTREPHENSMPRVEEEMLPLFPNLQDGHSQFCDNIGSKDPSDESENIKEDTSVSDCSVGTKTEIGISGILRISTEVDQDVQQLLGSDAKDEEANGDEFDRDEQLLLRSDTKDRRPNGIGVDQDAQQLQGSDTEDQGPNGIEVDQDEQLLLGSHTKDQGPTGNQSEQILPSSDTNDQEPNAVEVEVDQDEQQLLEFDTNDEGPNDIEVDQNDQLLPESHIKDQGPTNIEVDQDVRLLPGLDRKDQGPNDFEVQDIMSDSDFSSCRDDGNDAGRVSIGPCEFKVEASIDNDGNVISPDNEMHSASVLEHTQDKKFKYIHPFVELSLCKHLLYEGMGEDAAAQAFESEKLTLEKFRALGHPLLRNSRLVVRMAGRYFPWDAAAPIIMGMVSFGEEHVLEPKGMIKVERVDKNTGGSWRLWPFSFRRTKTVSTVHVEQEGCNENSSISSLRSSNAETETKGAKKKKKMLRSLTPTSDQLKSLNLNDGRNKITFTFSTAMLGKQQVEAHIYKWKWDTRIVISDVDGTITKSDVLGQFMPLVGVDWSQTGVAQLYSEIKKNGYELLFLSARAISQAHLTRQFLFNLKQDGKSLPDGPVVISPDGLFPSLYREVIRRAPHEFKISCLEVIKALFPPEHNPFYAGFGNRDTDELSYLKVGIPLSKIYIINPKGEVTVNRLVNTKSYSSLHRLVDHMFPPMHASVQEEYGDLMHWKRLNPYAID